ncbi:hypothetical protein QYF61_026286 [Mycteria americana]|uniref:Uncharacterized protein n=1 Tax=Mycteria americana TaxID=33587 RepID=A0AAN7MW29_MYCAM|nr:hypothetical protein QYF61_026281 [Mycteria americana]KAK4814704.1 hypothetical protein QYF61_026283 [Mycteria americana]KAK4814705.1 hypothetical protein QYF61_026284 [Mycteria americana]KAK4814706.1 hypothetical protein QYF61_026285 [Mycteria americana]KAK4814707.1 hypothetical protein QYF61_026286 [Mycteria americana]
MTISQLFSMACKVRNNREEIEEKEKRGRVTLQASFVGCLEGRPGKRERKYRSRGTQGQPAFKEQHGDICVEP